MQKANSKEAAKYQYEIPTKSTPASVSASLCALVGFILVGSVAFASLALTVWNVTQVNHQNSSVDTQVNHQNPNIAELEQMIAVLQTFMSESKVELRRIHVSLNDSASKFQQLEQRIHNSVNDLNESQSKVVRSLSSEVNNVIRLLSGQYSNIPAASCSQVFQLNSFSLSGHYWIRSSRGSAVRVYCDFNRQCGCDGPSGWTRVGYLNMSNPDHVCPRNWVTISSPVRTCGLGQASGCQSVYFSTFDLIYRRVCGRITAYQYGTPDALDYIINHGSDINSAHLDGISLTHSRGSQRHHIWSFICAGGEGNTFQSFTICACSSSRRWSHSTFFLGNDYFCDSGNNNTTPSSSTFYSDDPLWDGQGCGPSSTCCQFNNPPWFCKTLPQSTTNGLEVRICKNSINEDTPVQLIELYIQ